MVDNLAKIIEKRKYDIEKRKYHIFHNYASGYLRTFNSYYSPKNGEKYNQRPLLPGEMQDAYDLGVRAAHIRYWFDGLIVGRGHPHLDPTLSADEAIAAVKVQLENAEKLKAQLEAEGWKNHGHDGAYAD